MFEHMMDVGRHGTIAACMRKALKNYAIHFARQGLMDVPARAFEFTKGKRGAL